LASDLLGGGLRLHTACDLEVLDEAAPRDDSRLPGLDELTARLGELAPQGRDVFGDGAALTVEWSGKNA